MTITAPVRRPLWRRIVFNRALWILVALLATAAASWWVWRATYGGTDLRDKYLFATVQRAEIQDLVTATGTVQPRDYVDVGAQVSGQLKKLHVDIGSMVQAGDLLAEIDPTVLKATVDARRAGLRNQRATLAERESQLVLANLLLTRQQNLMKDDATTAESLQQAEANARAAKAQVAASRATIEQTESTLRADDANLNYAKIYAPLAGTVVTVTARQGQTLNANQQAPTILRIADLSTMTVQTQVSEADVSKLRPGMEVYFTTLGSQGKRWYGALRKIEPTPTVTNNVVLYNALFDVPNANQALMTSMTAQVFFVAASAKNALVVPASALSGGARGADGTGRRERGAGGSGRAPRGAAAEASAASASTGRSSAFASDSARERRRTTVQLLTAAGTLEDRAVELGVSNRVQTQVLSGLVEGDQVVAGIKLPPAPPGAPLQNQASGLQPGGAGLPPGAGGGFGARPR